MKRLFLFLFLLTPFLFAVESKEVGNANISMNLQWIVEGNAPGEKVLKTYSFPNTPFQKVELTSNVPFETEKDSFGNEVLVFKWNEDGTKTIMLAVLANVDFDSPFAQADSSSAQKYLKQTSLVLTDSSIETQAEMLGEGAEDDSEKLARVTEWVHNSVEYDDGFWERQPTSSDVFIQRKGVCNQYAHLEMALLRALEIPSRFVAGWVYSGKEWAPHAWVEALIDGRWVPADPTYNEGGFLDGTHVVFAYGSDQLDIKEELSMGLTMRKQADIQLLEFSKPRDYFDLQLETPSVVSSLASEKISVSVKNKNSEPKAIPIKLNVPSQPPELEVKLAQPDSRLLYVKPGETQKAEWDALFPKLDDGFTYNFTIEAVSLGKRVLKTIGGESKAKTSFKTNILLSGVESSETDSTVTISATLFNSGNLDGTANVFLSLGGNNIEQQAVFLKSGESKKIEFSLQKPLDFNEGTLSISTESGVFNQPFSIVTSKPLAPGGLSVELIVMAAVLVAAVALLVYFVRRKKGNPKAFEEY
jgi:transglutaminase-like putative cysteine protease